MAYAILFSFALYSYYWVVALAPFTAMAIFFNQSKLNFLLICNTAAELGAVLQALPRPHYFNLTWINNMGLFRKVFDIQNQVYINAGEIVPKSIPLYAANLYIIGIIIFVLCTYPGNKLSIPNFENNGQVNRTIVLARFGLSIAIIMLNLFCYFYTWCFIGLL